MDEAKTGRELAPSPNNKPEIAPERPIRRIIWENPPVGPYDRAIRERLAEFYRGEDIPPEVRALGVLTAEMLIKDAKELGLASFKEALYTHGPYAGEPTLYGMALYADRLDLALTPIPEYGNFSIQAISIPLRELNDATGNVSAAIASQRPDILRVLLSAEATDMAKNQAKVDLMRFLQAERPGSVKKIGEFGGLFTTGVAYAPDERTMVTKLYIGEIPETDPILGEVIQFNDASSEYRKTLERMEMEEYDQMTVEQVAQRLKTMPDWARKVLKVDHFNERGRAHDIYRFMRRLKLIKPNEAQSKWEKIYRVKSGFGAFDQELRGKILDTIASGQSPDEVGLTNDQVDDMFKRSYERGGWHKLPQGFSITKAVTDEIPLQDLPL